MNKLGLTVITIGALACLSSSHAAVITQQQQFNYSYGPDSGTGAITLVNDGDFTAEMLPFDTNLGSLNSFSVDWLLEFDASGAAGSADDAIIFSSAVGSVSLGGINYSGIGGGDGAGEPEGTTINIGYTLPHSQTFEVLDAGVRYDPNILAAVLGDMTFNLLYDTDVQVDFSNVIDFNAYLNGQVVLTYDYTANTTDVSSPATLTLFGLTLAGLGWPRRK